MREVTHNTSTGTEGEVGYVEWPVSYNEPESVDEFTEFYGGADNLISALRAALKQSVTQNNKTPVAKAAKALAADPDNAELQAALQKAISDHQAGAAKYRPGAPRGKADETGMTAKQKAAFGAAVGRFAIETGKMPGAKDLAAIAKELGIDFSAVNGG
jgi:hypothetical protein